LTISYAALDQVLAQSDATFGAAECHGVLSGLVCALGDEGLGPFLESALLQTDPESPQTRQLPEILTELFAQTLAMLQDPACLFYPLLPADDVAIDLRVQMLAEWCQGFLVGLHQGGITDFKALPGDCPEMIEDLTEFARAQMYTVDHGEEDERAYNELVEFLHAGVLLMYGELQSGGDAQSSPPPALH